MTYPKTAYAITIAKTGDVDVLDKTEVPLDVKPDHVVVKVEYMGVNMIDTYFRKGLYPLKSFPTTLGMEAAGTIVGLPSDDGVLGNKDYKERKFQVGEKVVVNTAGVHASYVSVPWKTAYPVPSSVPILAAAAGLMQSLTAVTFMTESYLVKPNDIVLVHTVAGGLGLQLAQYAKSKGARVVGTTSTKEKAELAKRCAGVDWVVIYKEEDTVQRVLEITNGEGVDAIFDGVGKDTFEGDFKMIKRKGTIVAIGNASGPIPPFSPLKLSEKNIKLLRPNFMNYLVTPAESLHYGSLVLDLIDKGVLKVNVYKEYEFSAEGVRAAHTDLVSGKTTGKLVIKVD